MKPRKKIANYEIIDTLYAREGYGCYLACGPDDKQYVIKAFDLSIIEDAAAELKAARQLQDINHPNLVRVIEVKRDPKLKIYYYVMEHWGDDLRNTIKVKPDPKVAIDIVSQGLEGLAELHKHKMTHRDVKPENIVIKNGIAKLGDYGLVKSKRYLTQLTTIAGTRDYMAPEVLEGKPYDNRCDIYSTGVVLRELLTDERPPFNAPDDYPDEVTRKAMAKEPANRYQSVEEFINALTHRRGAEVAEKISNTPKLSVSAESQQNPDLIVGAVKSPIFQKLDIQRYPPKPTLYGEQDKPGVLIQTLQAQMDELAKGDDCEAMLKVARPLADEVERRFGKDNSRTADAYDRLAWVFLKRGDYRAASEWYSGASGIDLKLYNEHSREYLNSLYHLAEVRLAALDYPAAQEYYNRMTVIMAKLPIKDHPEDAIIRNNSSAVNHHLKEYRNAIDSYQKALAINEKHSKLDAMAINLYNMGLAYEAMGNTPAAEPLFKKAAYFAGRVLKPDDPLMKRIGGSL
ncbi:MAG: serine/threonine protein kinase [Planctomycetes bacterium]|nr:serine/threonine protein kinase [Planctomycetota bacterium]